MRTSYVILDPDNITVGALYYIPLNSVPGGPYPVRNDSLPAPTPSPSSDAIVAEIVVSPPFVFVPCVKSELKLQLQVAAQNCWVKKGGAFTCEISVEMLVNLGIPWVIIGHSERRAIFNESNEFVGQKVAYALSQGLKVIACVGDTLEEREAGTTMKVVAAQTKAIADKISSWDNVVLAYEPVWAIGTGKVATPAQAQEVHAELRKWLERYSKLWWIIGSLGVGLALVIAVAALFVCLRSSIGFQDGHMNHLKDPENEQVSHKFHILRTSSFWCGSGRLLQK